MCVCAVVVLFFYSLHCLLPCFIFAWIPGYSVWHSSFSSSSNSDYSVCVCGCGLLQSETFNIPHQSLMRCKAVCCCCTQLWWRRRLVARSCRCFFFFLIFVWSVVFVCVTPYHHLSWPPNICCAAATAAAAPKLEWSMCVHWVPESLVYAHYVLWIFGKIFSTISQVLMENVIFFCPLLHHVYFHPFIDTEIVLYFFVLLVTSTMRSSCCVSLILLAARVWQIHDDDEYAIKNIEQKKNAEIYCEDGVAEATA